MGLGLSMLIVAIGLLISLSIPIRRKP